MPDEKEIAEQHARIKRKLQKRRLQPIQNVNQAKISDIIAVSKDDGEFNYSNPNHVKKSPSRIHLQIIKLAKYAEEIHLKNNFEFQRIVQPKKSKQKTYSNTHATVNDKLTDKDFIATMKSDCKNIITRISTNEFFFYPNKNDGPLSEEGFGKLIQRLEKLAANLPENLHLSLGTFPVANDLKQVNNVLVYIQCGLNPRLDCFAKAFPATLDPEYPGFKNVTFQGDEVSLTRRCNLFEYKYTNFHGKMLVRQKGYITNHGGQITCSTAGGLLFRTAIDICLDAYKKVSRLTLETDINDDKSSLANIIPTHVSQMISSSSIDKEDIERISRSKLFTHTDPLERGISDNKFFKRISPSGVDELKNCFFGSNIKISIYEPIAIDKLQDNYYILLNKHNELVLTLDAYRILLAQRPYQAVEVRRLIDKEILNYFTEQLIEINNKKLSPKLLLLKNDMHNYFNESLLENTDFRKLVHNYHNNLLTRFNEGHEKDIAPLLDILSIMNGLLIKDTMSESMNSSQTNNLDINDTGEIKAETKTVLKK